MASLNYIHTGIYLGDIDSVYQENLKNLGISHLLTIYIKPLTKSLHQNFKYKFVYAQDEESADLLSHFVECIDFIDSALSNHTSVLVHCFAGRSRSATIVIAYLMKTLLLSAEEAMTMVNKQRFVQPNAGFLKQLSLYEKMGNAIDFRCPEMKVFKLDCLVAQARAAGAVPDLAEYLGSSDSPCDNNETLYKCRKCRINLFAQSSVLLHQLGNSDVFLWRNGKQDTDGCAHASTERCKRSLFVEPIKWMKDHILTLEGKLNCPKCNGKLGSFNWFGERCPCGEWITPAFHIQTAKVDACSPRITHSA